MHNETDQIKTVLDALDNGVYIIDLNFTIQYMNKAMIRDFGEGVGRKCHDVINSLDVKCPICKAPEVFKGQSFNREIYFKSADKTYNVVEMPFLNHDETLSKLTIFLDMKDRNIQEESFLKSYEDYKRLFEHVGCGVYFSSKDGKFLEANPALQKILGYESKEEILNIDLSRDMYLNPEDRREFRKLIEQNGHVIDYKVVFKRKDGTPFPALLTSHVRYDSEGNIAGYEGIIVDETLRKALESEIRQAHDFLNKIIQNSPNAIMASDMKGRILLWNQAAEKILDYKTQDVLNGMNIIDVYPEGVARKVIRMLRSDSYGGVGRLTPVSIMFKRSDGKEVEGNLTAAIIYNDDGEEIATVGIFVDLEERLAMEHKLRNTQEQLLQSEKLAAMGRLTSQIAHELNNPLYGIMNTLELMKTEISPQNKRRKLLEMALSETVRLTDLLRKMLTFSKPDLEIRKNVDVNVILDEILLLYNKQLQELDIKIIFEPADQLPSVYASTNQLRQVFLNMISNAKDAMPDGGALSVITSQSNDFIEIVISDTGSGIKDENIGRIFDAFFSTKDSIKGVGLGLSVCYGFIKDHGGDIKVKSRLDKGTAFTITLPVNRNENV